MAAFRGYIEYLDCEQRSDYQEPQYTEKYDRDAIKILRRLRKRAKGPVRRDFVKNTASTGSVCKRISVVVCVKLTRTAARNQELDG